jgi:hypothetical protein
MTHPNPQDLLDFLYDELDPSRRAEVASHLAACNACQGRVAAWGGVRRELATWEIPEHARHPSPALPARRAWPVVRWATAAAVLIATGFGLARLSVSQTPVAATTPDVSTLRTELAREIRRELHDELRATLHSEMAAGHAKFASDEADRREAFQQVVARALSELEVRQLASHTALRRDVETLALRAREELDQLAVAAQPAEGAPQQQ